MAAGWMRFGTRSPQTGKGHAVKRSGMHGMLASGLFCCFVVSGASAADPYAGLSVSEKVRRENDPLLHRLKQIEQELEPIPQIAKLKHVAAHPEGLSDDDLKKVLAIASRSRDKAYRKWKHVEEMLAKQKFATVNVLGRVVAQSLTAAGNVAECNARKKEIEDRARAVWAAHYPPDIRPPFSNWWMTPMAERFRLETAAAEAWLVRENKKVLEELRHGWPAIDTMIDNLQNEVLREYQITVYAVRAITEEIERRRAGIERTKKAEVLRGQLHLRTNASTEHLKTGETAEIWFWIDKGYPPYYVRVFEDQTKLLITQTYTKAQAFMIPFRFLKAGTYLVQIDAYDEDPSHRFVKVLFHVTGDEIVPVETPDPGKPTTKPAKKPPATQPTTQPATQPAKPAAPKPLVGRFSALLHGHLSLVSSASSYLTKEGSDAPIPLIIEIDSTGRITGQANYEVPRSHRSPDTQKVWKSFYANVSFRLEGTTDPKTGKTTLRLLDVNNRHGGLPNLAEDIRENAIKSDVTLKGWRIPGPQDEALLKTPVMSAVKASKPTSKSPRITRRPDGTVTFAHDGFVGMPGMQGGPPVTYKVHSTTRTVKGKAKDQGRDNLQRTMDRQSSSMTWYLQVLGPAPPPAAPSAPTLTSWGPLISIALWPKSPVTRIEDGRPVEFDARGVFRDNVWEPIKMNPLAEWEHSPKDGLREVSPGKYQPLKAGTYTVVARVFDRDQWFRDVIKIVVKPRPPPRK